MGIKEENKQSLIGTLELIPSAQFVLTANHEDRRSGTLVRWVQQTSSQPPMIMVAVGKGRPILAMISDARRFGLCQLPEEDRLITHKFNSSTPLFDDPFLGFKMLGATSTGLPILANVIGFLECEMICHMDVEGDHDLFVGRVVNGLLLDGQSGIKIPGGGTQVIV